MVVLNLSLMSYSADVADALRDAEVEPVDFLDRRNKYLTGIVRNGDHVSFMKIVAPGQGPSTREDLFIETTWNNHFREELGAQGFKIPQTEQHDKNYRWVLFERMNGSQVKESNVRSILRDAARLCVAISQVPVGRQPNGHKEWLLQRLAKMIPKASRNEFLGADVMEDIAGIAEGKLNIGEVRSAPIHGDLKPDNILINDDVYYVDDSLIIVDAEFGTVPQDRVEALAYHSELDKPLHFDAAYFYHLLYCQYHDPISAELFLDHYREEFRRATECDLDTFEREFGIALLERTVSMGNHFVWNPNPNLIIADERRTDPGPYRALIHQSLDSISS